MSTGLLQKSISWLLNLEVALESGDNNLLITYELGFGLGKMLVLLILFYSGQLNSPVNLNYFNASY